MSKFSLKSWKRRLKSGVSLLLLLLISVGETPLPTQDQKLRLDILSGSESFDFITWEITALARKAAYGLLAPQRFMTEENRSRFVLTCLANVWEARRLSYDIADVYSDPAVANPEQTTAAQQENLAALREELAQQSPIAEAILGEQISQVLADSGFGCCRQILPPVSGTFTPLPTVLIISPRDHIEEIYQNELVAGLNAAQRQALETKIEAAESDISAYVTTIGGLSAYPAMLLESSSLGRIADVMTHEWTHHYLLPAPLGWHYSDADETRTINETTASLMGEWGGQEVVRRFYVPILPVTKPLPDPLTSEEEEGEEGLQLGAQPDTPSSFYFHAEMHDTRAITDRLLEKGQIIAAEQYMESRRHVFSEHGYHLRRLNQAYFAFHGAYASRPLGPATGGSSDDTADDLSDDTANSYSWGAAVRQLWSLSETPHDFARQISRVTTLAELEQLLNR